MKYNIQYSGGFVPHVEAKTNLSNFSPRLDF